ncbi:sugar ABC transporter ATP-binding protein [Dongia sp.]|uniref:sugar ABC transporter ATP-binding protein n=1 Tax=Dongia sp. TaxID=1977262 RepID=UPI0035AEC05D
MADAFLQLTQISKSYPGIRALEDVSFAVAPGEVIGLVGENGAGKSTLMKILGGVVAPSSGVIHVDGQERPALTVREATAAGIAFVHQELNLFENLDVASNVFIGREPCMAGPMKLVDRRALHERAKPYLDQLKVDFKSTSLVSDLSIGQRQLLEIAKALSLDARLIIMDEPTSSLTLAETERLLAIMDDLKGKGVAIIFITHRLNELTACADRVMVLRDGRIVGHLPKERVSHGEMIRLMIGRDLKSLYLPPAEAPGDAVLELRDLRTETYPDQPVSLSIRRGEIMGLAGLIGAGRTELARAIFGIDRIRGGSILLDGQEVVISAPRMAIERGIFLVPEDRKKSGLLLDLSIAENIALPTLQAYTRMGLVRGEPLRLEAEQQKQKLHIRAPSTRISAAELSGGNQQKVVLAKWLGLHPRLLICDEPTRGIDVGAKTDLYRMLRDLADAGVAILMISSDMEEVIGVSDRIAVMHEGRISGYLDRPSFSEANVLRLAVGAALVTNEMESPEGDAA